MSELERLSAQADVMPLMRTHGGLVLSQEGRQLQSALRRAAAGGVGQVAEIRVATQVTKETMDSATEVDDYRKLKAGDDAALNSALVQIELNHLSIIGRIQRGSAF